MIDKIPLLGGSWIGTLIGYVVLVFLYYFLWMTLTMVLLNKTTKDTFIYGEKSLSKLVAGSIVLLFIFIGLNISMYALGLYAQHSDSVFLFLISILFSVMIVTMIDIMGSKFSGAEEFYDTVIAFILTVGFLSPTKGLLTLNLFDKLYLLAALLITFILFSFNFVRNWAGNINSGFMKFLIRYRGVK
jgi:hypothetical protein